MRIPDPPLTEPMLNGGKITQAWQRYFVAMSTMIKGLQAPREVELLDSTGAVKGSARIIQAGRFATFSFKVSDAGAFSLKGLPLPEVATKVYGGDTTVSLLATLKTDGYVVGSVYGATPAVFTGTVITAQES